jgi:hypothetical protein
LDGFIEVAEIFAMKVTDSYKNSSSENNSYVWDLCEIKK